MSAMTRIKSDQDGRGRGLVAARDFRQGDRIVPYISKLRSQSELKASVDQWRRQEDRGPALTAVCDFVSDETHGAVYVGYVPRKPDGQVDEANACLINDVCSAALIQRRHA